MSGKPALTQLPLAKLASPSYNLCVIEQHRRYFPQLNISPTSSYFTYPLYSSPNCLPFPSPLTSNLKCKSTFTSLHSYSKTDNTQVPPHSARASRAFPRRPQTAKLGGYFLNLQFHLRIRTPLHPGHQTPLQFRPQLFTSRRRLEIWRVHGQGREVG